MKMTLTLTLLLKKKLNNLNLKNSINSNGTKLLQTERDISSTTWELVAQQAMSIQTCFLKSFENTTLIVLRNLNTISLNIDLMAMIDSSMNLISITLIKLTLDMNS